MRILVISDSHGRNDDIEGVLKQVGDIDMMIHCGDVERCLLYTSIQSSDVTVRSVTWFVSYQERQRITQY